MEEPCWVFAQRSIPPQVGHIPDLRVLEPVEEIAKVGGFVRPRKTYGNKAEFFRLFYESLVTHERSRSPAVQSREEILYPRRIIYYDIGEKKGRQGHEKDNQVNQDDP
jgi:hypothetical protein